MWAAHGLSESRSERSDKAGSRRPGPRARADRSPELGVAPQAFFEQHGAVRSVRMRRHLRSGDFKGSVFVELDSEELAKEVRSSRRRPQEVIMLGSQAW